MRQAYQSWRARLICCGLLGLLMVIGCGTAGTTARGVASKPPVFHQRSNIQGFAVRNERVAQRRQVVPICERLVVANTALRTAFSFFLVRGNAGMGYKDEELKWLLEPVRNDQGPNAALAGVYAGLGQFWEARRNLQSEIASETQPLRSVVLRWQLAELWEKTDNRTEVRKALGEAEEAVEGMAAKSVAQQWLEALEKTTHLTHASRN